MARTQINEFNIKDGALTGASLRNELKLYNETKNYSSGDRVLWQGEWWEANTSITGTDEGDLSNAPDSSSDWDKVTNLIWAAYPSSAQTFNNTAVVMALDTERKTNGGITLSSNVITFNVSGEFIISAEYSATNTSSTRMTSNAYIEVSTDGGTNWTTITSSTMWSYNRESTYGQSTGAVSLPITVNKDDQYRISMISSNSTNITNIVNGCSVLIFAIGGAQGPKGVKGDKGDTGAAGDIDWQGPYDSGTTYDENEAVERLGTSYVSTVDNNTETPSDTATNWDIIAKKGADGSGTQINVADEGTNIANTPHGTLNFVGSAITATDGGSGSATITVNPTKHVYMVPVWAEENAALAANTYEWAFGNGGNTAQNNGVAILIPSGYSCEVTGMSLTLNAGSAEVEIEINGASISRSVSADVGAGNKSVATEFSSGVSVSNGDRLNFKTVTASNTSATNVVCAWLKYTEN